MNRGSRGRAIAGPALAMTAALLASCSTAQVVSPPVPTPRETPINSLALEQCIRENGPETCAADGQ